MSNTNDTKCAHPSCNCTRSKDSDYCGAACQDAGTTEGTLDILCACGHPGCATH